MVVEAGGKGGKYEGWKRGRVEGRQVELGARRQECSVVGRLEEREAGRGLSPLFELLCPGNRRE